MSSPRTTCTELDDAHRDALPDAEQRATAPECGDWLADDRAKQGHTRPGGLPNLVPLTRNDPRIKAGSLLDQLTLVVGERSHRPARTATSEGERSS